jgi:Tol biopolymer transport system component
MRRLLERCLRKDVKSRLQAIGDARIMLEEKDDPPLPPAKGARVGIVAALMLAVGALAALAVVTTRPHPVTPNITRFSIPLVPTQQFIGLARAVVAVSPDGKTIAYSARSPAMLYVRALNDLETKAVRGTESPGAAPTGPLFSPDGRYLVYWTNIDQSLKRIPVEGGAPLTVCKTELPDGMTWTGDDIVFSNTEGIQRVSPNGGTPERLVAIDTGESAFGPLLLPGGQAVLFTVAPVTGSDGRWDRAKVVVQPLPSGPRKTLIEGAADARYLQTGHIVFARAGVLYAVPFDIDRLAITGKETPVVEGVRRGIGTVGAASANYSVSDTGTLVYVPGPLATNSSQLQLALLDAAGGIKVLDVRPGPYGRPRVSPDGRHIAFESHDGKDANIWVRDVGGRGAARRLTFGGSNRSPAWSADSRRVAFQSDREGDLGISWQRADGTGPPERLTRADRGTEQRPLSWAPGGDRFLFDSTTNGRTTLWVYSIRDRQAKRFAGLESTNLTGAVFSPDGHWVAYAAREAGGRNAVYVEPFPQTGAKYQISNSSEDGHHPLWTANGKQLIYVPGPGTRLVRVPAATSPTFSFGAPSFIEEPFFNTAGSVERGFDLMPDGDRIVSLRGGSAQGGDASAEEIRVVLNWFQELKGK